VRVESINLGAVLFALLVLLWVGYALPRVASRREVMGRARAADLAEASPGARDLSEAVRSHRSTREVTSPMPEDRLLLRPADPTSRPRFDAAPGVRIDPVAERARSRRALRVALGGLVLVTLGLIVAAVAQLVAWWPPVLSAAALGAYLVGLRRAEMERRTRARRARALSTEDDAAETAAPSSSSSSSLARAGTAPTTAGEGTSAPRPAAAPGGTLISSETRHPVQRATLEETSQRAAEQVARAGEWTPRPVPLPTYALRGEVEDLATRHAAHRSALGSTALERDGIEELEAAAEEPAPVKELHLDEILERRRA